LQESSDSELDPDLVGPPTKRIRRSTDRDRGDRSEAEEEYRTAVGKKEKNSKVNSVVERSNTDMSVFSEPLTDGFGRKWDSGVLDIGYSSGENSLGDMMISDAGEGVGDTQTIMQKRTETKVATPRFHATVTYDELTHESFTDVDRNPLTDSMHVNYDALNGNCPEYDEVMALLDETTPLTREHHVSDSSFNTRWREIGGGGVHLEKSRRRQTHDDDDHAKHSCDASSEESSDWESRNERLMHRSFNDFNGGGSVTNSLPGTRIDPKTSNFLLDSSPLDASFCSTRSELTRDQCRTRKRHRVRRLPRSMSDGEQLVVKSGSGFPFSLQRCSYLEAHYRCPEMRSLFAALLTPQICRSPPATPLARSTRLLQKLDRDLVANLESDTAPEHSDTQVYEWDEYNVGDNVLFSEFTALLVKIMSLAFGFQPPAKDDSMTEPPASSSPGVRDDLLEIDEDFSEHFDALNSLCRLVTESRAHLRVVEKSITSFDVDEAQLKNIQMIAKANLRQLDMVIRMSGGGGRSEDITGLREQWRLLSEQAASPIPQLLSKNYVTIFEVSPISSQFD
uniref:Protein kinase domain-containing protein n=1 Tax=Angiostrongylus cantonensis TaxID=6313 RepID=A0A158P8C4_ANGCA